MLYLVDPALTGADFRQSHAFLTAARPVLKYSPLCEVTVDTVYDTTPGDSDGVILFSPSDQAVSQRVSGFLQRAVNAGAVVLPVALDESCRQPPEAVSQHQSFDVVDQLRQRDLSPSAVPVVARAFAREVLSKIQPTYARGRLRLFICYRRADGEHEAATLDHALAARHEHVFRDLIDIQTGEMAQDRIDYALSGADVVVFLDTPRAGESEWVSRELAGALGAHIPIVWVHLGPDEEARTPLPVQPAESPHLSLDAAGGDGAAHSLADDILDRAFDLSRTHVRAAQSAFEAVRAWADANGVEVRVLDQRMMIYELRHPAPERPYPIRRATDIIQVYGRHPDEQDRQRLAAWLENQSMGPHDRECRAFDAAIMLVPLPVPISMVTDWSVVESAQRYLANLPRAEAVGDASATRPGLLLVGAFPSGPMSHQPVMDAVHAVTTTWLRLGGSIVMGGHPTFTPLVTEAARLTVPGREQQSITIYQSRYFAADGAVAELSSRARVVATDANDGRTASLTAMRERMAAEPSIRAVVAIGGRTHEGGTHVPGIDEEIEFALARGLPVFLLGAPGGRAAELAEAIVTGHQTWSQMNNPLSDPDNEEMATTDDFEVAAETIWSTVRPD